MHPLGANRAYAFLGQLAAGPRAEPPLTPTCRKEAEMTASRTFVLRLERVFPLRAQRSTGAHRPAGAPQVVGPHGFTAPSVESMRGERIAMQPPAGLHLSGEFGT